MEEQRAGLEAKEQEVQTKEQEEQEVMEKATKLEGLLASLEGDKAGAGGRGEDKRSAE